MPWTFTIALFWILSGTVFMSQPQEIASKTARPAIRVTPSVVDLGMLTSHGDHRFSIRIANTGTAPLHVTKVEGDRNLLVPDQYQVPFTIPPGKEAAVDLTFFPRNLAFVQHRTIRVHSDAPERPVVEVKLTVYVQKDYEISPPFLLFRNLAPGAKTCQTVHIRSLREEPIRVSHVTASDPFLEAAFRREKEGEGLLDVTVDADQVPRDKAKVVGSIFFKTDSTVDPEGKVTVVVESARGCFLQPRMLVKQDLDPDQGFEARVRILSRGGAVPEVTSVRYQGEGLVLEEWTPEGEGIRLACKVSPSVRRRILTGGFEVTLAPPAPGEGETKLRLPFTGRLADAAADRLHLAPPATIVKPVDTAPEGRDGSGKIEALSDLPPAPEGAKPCLEVDRLEQDFGKVLQGPSLETTFTLRNTGDGPLRILAVHASCGCVVPEKIKGTVIPPGGTHEMKVALTTAHKALSLSKTLTVKSNDPEHPALRLKLRAYVHVDWRLAQVQLALHDVCADRVYEEKVYVDAYMDHPLEFRDFRADHPFVHASFEPTRRPNRFLLRVVFDTRGLILGRGRIGGHLRFHTNSAQLPEGDLTYYLETIRDVRVSPRRVYLFRILDRPGLGKEEQEVRVENVRGREMRLREARLDDVKEGVIERVQETGAALVVKLRIPPDLPPCSRRGKLVLLLDGAEDREIEIPVTLTVRGTRRR